MKTLKLALITVLVLIGAALILPATATWEALQIQAGLGNPAPLTSALVKMSGGIICIAIAWVALKRSGNE